MSNNSKQPLGAVGFLPKPLQNLNAHYTRHHKFYVEKAEHYSPPDNKEQLLRVDVVLCNPRQTHEKLSMLYERRVADVSLNASCPAADSQSPAAGKSIPQSMPLDVRLAIGNLMAADGYAIVQSTSGKDRSMVELQRHDEAMQLNPDGEGEDAFYTECTKETVKVAWSSN